MSHELLHAAQSLHDWLVLQRRTLHTMPELSLQEFKTSEHCAGELRKLGLAVRKLWGEGFVADIDAPRANSRIALRADMDALPITEQNDLSWHSRHDGVAHMCGHDTHMTVLLGAARLLTERKSELRRGVRFIFQPSEEMPPGGAKGLIEQGALEGIDEVYGLHNNPQMEVGQVATRAGALTAAADIFTIKLTGRGGHASRPHEAIDPIPACCELVGMLQTLISRRVQPGKPAVLSVTKLKAGTTHNIIPDDAELTGTVRTYEEPVRARIIEEMERMTAAVAGAHGLRHEFSYLRGYDSIVNHESGVARVACAAARIVGEQNVETGYEAQTWGEDFSYYLQHRPGAFFLLGSGNKAAGISEPLHSPRFNVDERCLPIGVAIMCELALGA